MPLLMLNSQFEWQQKFSALGKHMIVVPRSLSLIKRLPSSLRKSLDFGPIYGATCLHHNWAELIHAYACCPSVHTSWSCLLPHVQQLLLALWLLLDSVTGKKCRQMWHPTSDTFPAPREPLSIPSGSFPSARCNPEGSSREGIFAAVRAC